MQIINKRPPQWIWDALHKMFEIDDMLTIYAYGDAIYNPAGIAIGEEYIEHESVHSKQQKAYGSPDEWWKYYLANESFRTNQEIEAYRHQHNFYCDKVRDRNKQALHLHRLAEVLSSPMYKCAITFNEAKKAIRG